MDDNEKLKIVNKAKELFDCTLTNTSNRKKFPAKYRVLVERMQNKSIDIYDCIMDANRKRLYIPNKHKLFLTVTNLICLLKLQ